QYGKAQQNLCTGLGNLKIHQESRNHPLIAAFFCLKSLIGYTCYGRSGGAASRWPFLLVRFS
ncbi:hypothetical protein, partial [Acinetobacter baumannii]|uniref:hypothetical protein n=1 Tax=Acinetobacter baumannii TaxID=470 RepID=UPI001BC879AE